VERRVFVRGAEGVGDCLKLLYYFFYEIELDEHIGFDLTKGREYNENVVNNWYKQLLMNPKLKIEWDRIMSMIQCFEITYGRYLSDTGEMFKEADKNHKLLIPRQVTPVHIIEIEDETPEIKLERINETNTVDINDMLQLSKIEK
jgi:hypothetical protein